MSAVDPEQEDLLAFFATDDRPTIVLQKALVSRASTASNYPPYVLFHNASFDELVSVLDEHSPSLPDWLNATHQNFLRERNGAVPIRIFAGQSWTSRILRCGWIVLFCSTSSWLTAAHMDSSKDSSDVTLSSSAQLYSKPGSFLDDHVCDWTSNIGLASDPWARYLMSHDWANTAIGPIATWPDDLRGRVVTIMSHPEPRCILWGNDMKLIYNEACLPRVGSKHPSSLGNPVVDNWGQVTYDHHMQAIQQSIKQCKASVIPDVALTAESRGMLEETYHTFTYTPIPGLDGRCVGFQLDYTDTTPLVFETNRRQILGAIAERTAKSERLSDIWSIVIETLDAKSEDVAYAMIYTVEQVSKDDDLPRFAYAGGFGIEASVFRPTPAPEVAQVFSKIQGTVELLQTKSGTLPLNLAATVSKGVVSNAYVVRINSNIGASLAFMVFGMNPRRPVEESRTFIRSLADTATRCIETVRLPEERRQFEESNLGLLDQLRVARVKAEKNEETIERMGRNCPAGMFILGPEGQPIYANDTYLNLLHLKREKWLATPKGEFAWDDSFEDPESVKVLLADLLTGTPAPFQIRAKGFTDGLPRWIEGVAFSELGPDGKVVSLQGWLYDISHRVYAESLKDERLREAVANKEATAKFLDMISHEIRNPMGSILLLAHDIKDNLPFPCTNSSLIASNTIDTIVDAANTILLCAQHQKHIVDDVLELSRMDSGLLELTFDRASPRHVIDETLKMFAADLKAADIKVETGAMPGYDEVAPHGIYLDSRRVTQILVNIVANAAKFTKAAATRKITVSYGAFQVPPIELRSGAYIPLRGGLSPHSTRTPMIRPPVGAAADGGMYLFFSVEDSGPGLTHTELASLFQRFSQASPKTYKQYGGSGLGLFISRELTELHGGQIGVRSAPGKGSDFFFYIQAFRSVPHDSRTQVIATHSSGRSSQKSLRPQVGPQSTLTISDPLSLILLVEDNLINQKVMRQQLQKIGCKSITVCDNGQQALDFIRTTGSYNKNSSSSLPLSMILLDIEMPVMDGITCISRIRDLEKSGTITHHIPVIAITANARQQQVDLALAAGMDEVITKPFLIGNLVARMEVLQTRYPTDKGQHSEKKSDREQND
ncbi:hypothetical protein K461DRAFT_282077 [Myriangium duriaei CBS 260.36]|uniref:histidine kinase n=1 Tax=Myriangium duriaei CBS 260.36 TaxID=1168546 RepID=A0A9P4IWC5_9PEZI|nr:hypothetical protein K461DRAFT_282077 [Myriangium duriaei CBS 260.36]